MSDPLKHPTCRTVLLLMMAIVAVHITGCATAKSPASISINVDTNPIPSIVIPSSLFSNSSVRLAVGLKPFANPANASVESIGIIEDRMAELLGWTDRCKVFETTNNSGIAYSIERTIRRYNINYQTIQTGKTPAWLKDISGKVFKVNGEPIDWGKASWNDTNKIVSVDCEFSLRFKRASDGELISSATGGFSRISSLKSLAVDLAGFELKRDHQSLTAAETSAASSTFVQGRIIQPALGHALLKLIPKLDGELKKLVYQTVPQKN